MYMHIHTYIYIYIHTVRNRVSDPSQQQATAGLLSLALIFFWHLKRKSVDEMLKKNFPPRLPRPNPSIPTRLGSGVCDHRRAESFASVSGWNVRSPCLCCRERASQGLVYVCIYMYTCICVNTYVFMCGWVVLHLMKCTQCLPALSRTRARPKVLHNMYICVHTYINVYV